MEESVGKIWDRLITRMAHKHHPQAAVTLSEMQKPVAILFRALGGDSGLRIETASARRYNAPRHWLQRIAGSGKQFELAWRDHESLRLPASLAVFADAALNRELYLWLAALASISVVSNKNWFRQNQQLTRQLLQRYPGLQARYQRLVDAQLTIRPDPQHLSATMQQQERAIRQALLQPGSIDELPETGRAPCPVWLWLYPAPYATNNTASANCTEEDTSATKEHVTEDAQDQRRRQGQREEMPDGRDGLLFYRFETLLSWAEYVKVNRCTDEEEDLAAANQVLDDLDNISVARDNQTANKRLRFDLDLPGAAFDDQPLGDGIPFPEWDYQRRQLIDKHVSVQPMLAHDANPCELPTQLRKTAQQIRTQFAALALSPAWHNNQYDGCEIDMDAYLQLRSQQLRGTASSEQALYRDFRRHSRDLACLMLADLSLSTDSWINNDMRVIDTIRDSLYLFAEALTATGDRFAMYGFSSRKRQHVRINWLKGFNEPFNTKVRGRIAAIRPGYYTRMGAAIRYTCKTLQRQPANQRLLLILTDGKPNDLDKYEGRYGAEDTRHAIIEARQLGIRPFCVTIDDQATDYLPHIFGNNSFVVIRDPAELPKRLPLLYAQLTS